jgi:hypothetical protein
MPDVNTSDNHRCQTPFGVKSVLLRYGLIVLCASIVNGCVTVRDSPIDQSVIPTLGGKSVITVKRTMPDFTAMTADKMAAGSLFGAIGGAVAGVSMIRSGNALVKENHIPDPAYEIAARIARAMETKYGITYSGISDAEIGDDDVSKLAAFYKTHSFALDIRTINWGFLYYPLYWTKYRLIYAARMRLIDTNSAGVLAEGGCYSLSDKIATAPTYEELLENGATRLKGEIEDIVSNCAQEFSTKHLGM